MIKEFVDAWDKNKNKLEKYFRENEQGKYARYIDIVGLLFMEIINPYLKNKGYNTKEITTIDDGDYQGTQIFLLHLDTYQPGVEDYIYTNTYYGSCSGCDTLQSISDYSFNKLPSEIQIKEYMELALHLLQKCKWLYEE